MIAPRSRGYGSDMSASNPSAAGVAPARTNSPPTMGTIRMAVTIAGMPAPWLTATAAATSAAPPPSP